MNRITFRLPESMVSELEEITNRLHFESKSEAVRQAVREFVSQHGRPLITDGGQIAPKPKSVDDAVNDHLHCALNVSEDIDVRYHIRSALAHLERREGRE